MSAINDEAIKLMREIDFIDRDTLELKKTIQYKGCPFCESDEGEFIENHQTKQALFYKFKKCNNCSIIYPFPRPDKTSLESYFKSQEFSEESMRRMKIFEEKTKMEKEKHKRQHFYVRIIRNIWRKSPFMYSYQEFKRFTKKGDRVLDVGAGMGIITKELLNKGCIVEAVEVSPYRAEYLRKNLGIKVYEKTFEEVILEESAYDVVIFSQVLMHLFSIRQTMQKLRSVLRPGGSVISSQMNFNSILQQTIRSPYPGKGLTAFSICSWFTAGSLKTVLERSGFKVIEVRFRPSGLFEYLFVDGYPGGCLTEFLLKAMDQIVKIILMRTGTSHYFAVIAQRLDE